MAKTSWRASSSRQRRLIGAVTTKKDIQFRCTWQYAIDPNIAKHPANTDRREQINGDKMTTWILQIIQLNKTIETNSNITICLSFSHLPSSFLDLVKQRKFQQIRQKLPSR